MSEQFQTPSYERASTKFETGDYIALHQSDLASIEVGRARADAAAAIEQRRSMEQSQTVFEHTKALGRHLIQMRQAEVDLAA